MFLVLLTLFACGKGNDTYDMATWQSPLASEFDGDPDVAQGEEIYFNEHWTDTSPYALTCFSCHSNSPDDTLAVDADEYNRPAHTVWNAGLRGSWKGGQKWDLEESNIIGAFGGEVCVTAYYPEGSDMTPEQAAHLEAYLKTLTDADPGDDPTAEPLDFSFTQWPTQEDFFAAISDGAGGWLSGADVGDPVAGEALATRHCGSCHTPEGEAAPIFYTALSLPVEDTVQRIRKAKIDDENTPPNQRMPRVPHDRLSDEELYDLLAFITTAEE